MKPPFYKDESYLMFTLIYIDNKLALKSLPARSSTMYLYTLQRPSEALNIYVHCLSVFSV